ncbi:MAG: hypothetical protein ACE5EH_05515 [Gammaproteobacteria bacterium]
MDRRHWLDGLYRCTCFTILRRCSGCRLKPARVHVESATCDGRNCLSEITFLDVTTVIWERRRRVRRRFRRKILQLDIESASSGAGAG